jgi:predicted KAP-like P-loop ATPase
MATKKFVLGDDLPKQNPWQDDRLGHAPFALRIARTIISMEAPHGYVIGLHGQWGSGKSSVLNFVLAVLNKHNQENSEDQVTHIDFRPWLISGHQDLIFAFFKILAEALGPIENRLIRGLKQSAKIVNGTTDRLVDAVATVALTVDPTAGPASNIAGEFAKKGVKSLIGRFLEDPSLQAAYEKLRSELKATKRRFLVTIDDIDRLEDEDVRSIMQMVKSIGRLPNVTYLLSYDRDIVWQALDRNKKRVGPRFAEKIVQQELELPVPRRNALLALLDREIAFLTDQIPDETRWQYIVRDGIHRWIRTPRDVVRLANAIKFSWPALENEIDRADLLAIEGLRLFDPSAFNWVRDNRDFFFHDGRFFMADDKLKSDIVEQLKRRLKEQDSDQVLHLLSILFPQARKPLGNDFGSENHIDVEKRRGIGSEEGYDNYFGLHPSVDAISKVAVHDFLGRLDNTDWIECTIRNYMGKTNSRGEVMIGKWLNQLRIHFYGRDAAKPTQQLLDALFRVGEDIISQDYPRHMFELTPESQLRFLIRNILEQWGESEAGSHLIDAFRQATSVAFMADIYVDRGRELGIFKYNSSEGPVIKSEDFKLLGDTLLPKILNAFADDSLEEAPFYFNIVRTWEYLGDPADVTAWLSKGMTKSAVFLAKAGRGLASYTLDTAEREYSVSDKFPEVFDLKALNAAARRHASSSELNHDQRKLVKELLRASDAILFHDDALSESTEN